MELSAGLWSELPSELVEQVLSFMPVPELCKFRSVCKRWNSLICTPEFGSLCIQNASKGACFVVKLRGLYSTRISGSTEISSWSIFDLNAKRWYNIKHELPKGGDYDVAAIDGGLVCKFVDAFTEQQRRTSTIGNRPTTTSPLTLIVSNLIGKTIKVLPNPPLVCTDLAWMNLNLVVDNISHTYKIFLVSMSHFWDHRDRCMCVYESSTNQWRSPPHPPSPPYPSKFGAGVLSAVFQGLLYVLFSFSSGIIYGLYSYNFVEDAWEDTGVKFWQSMLDLCDLVVSDNRLFLMTQRLEDRSFVNLRMGNTHTPWPLDISEILLADNACRTVVQMTEAEVCRNFDIQLSDRLTLKIQAHGFDKSILLMSREVHGRNGKYMLYNLVTGLWESLPPNPVESLHYPSGHQGFLWRDGKHMRNLSLPNTPWG